MELKELCRVLRVGIRGMCRAQKIEQKCRSTSTEAAVSIQRGLWVSLRV